MDVILVVFLVATDDQRDQNRSPVSIGYGRHLHASRGYENGKPSRRIATNIETGTFLKIGSNPKL